MWGFWNKQLKKSKCALNNAIKKTIIFAKMISSFCHDEGIM